VKEDNAKGKVSILVLLEVLLQPSAPATPPTDIPSFNPCFTGSLTATRWGCKSKS